MFGVALIALVMEAMRRTTGWIMPAVTGAFVLYALFGAYLPQSLDPQGLRGRAGWWATCT